MEHLPSSRFSRNITQRQLEKVENGLRRFVLGAFSLFVQSETKEPFNKNLMKICKLYMFQSGFDLRPFDSETGKLIESNVALHDTWKAMEEVCRKGLTKAIGVSNFNSKQLETILKVATIPPIIHQVRSIVTVRKENPQKRVGQKRMIFVYFLNFLQD